MTNEPAPLRWTRRAVLAGLGGLAALPRAARAAGSPARIASLGGAVTEILYRLGAADRIVAVDTTSIYPAEALREKPNVGYLRALSAEGLLSAGPDLVIAAEGAGPPDVLALVREAGVPVTLVKEPPTPEGVLDKIVTVGRLAGLDRQAAELAEAVGAQLAGLSRQRARIACRPGTRSSGGWRTAGAARSTSSSRALKGSGSPRSCNNGWPAAPCSRWPTNIPITAA